MRRLKSFLAICLISKSLLGLGATVHFKGEVKERDKVLIKMAELSLSIITSSKLPFTIKFYEKSGRSIASNRNKTITVTDFYKINIDNKMYRKIVIEAP